MNTNKSDIFIECIDHTVSKESFKLCLDSDIDMLITTPKPDVSNLAKYYESEDYISHTDAKRTVIEKLYHLVKNYSLHKKVQLISNLHKGSGTVLDIGAGTGDFLIKAYENNWNTEGIEPNDEARRLAKQKGLELVLDVEKIKSTSFDVITMWHVLEHVPDLDSQIKEIKRLLKPGGYVIIAVPNFKCYDAAYYKSFWAAYDVPRHLWHFSKKSIQCLFAKQNMVLEKVIPMQFDSYYVSLLSEKYKNGKINYFRAFFIGLVSNVKGLFTKEYSSHIYVIKSS